MERDEFAAHVDPNPPLVVIFKFAQFVKETVTIVTIIDT